MKNGLYTKNYCFVIIDDQTIKIMTKQIIL